MPAKAGIQKDGADGSRRGGGPAPLWTPAFAGVTGKMGTTVIASTDGGAAIRTDTEPPRARPAPPGRPMHPHVVPAQAVMPAEAGIQKDGAAAPEGVGGRHRSGLQLSLE